MKFGYYSDKELPKSVALDRKPIADYKTNSYIIIPNLTGRGVNCYKIGGKKRSLHFKYDYHTKRLVKIELSLDRYTPSYFNKVANALGKKYKETYRLSSQQKTYINYDYIL